MRFWAGGHKSGIPRQEAIKIGHTFVQGMPGNLSIYTFE